ncbi:PREDICTED: uncharacterized protein LOC104801101 [Tarenaya hassleriana]|uniref:uncharacterized protein LOC104801101 n=1 Tax=Tarenaya hassleriana TaxID=28532 RepID=UPI00053C23B5|nr:PREDICTED: uncharacterized protein LOC104801101 [Tarenaya hassleriana]
MLGLSYGELFLLIGATAALVGPKDLPIIARVAGRLAGRAIGYVQLARGQLDSVMQQSQARQVHKELQDTMAQLEAIRHEIRSISLVNPGPLTRRVEDIPPESSPSHPEPSPSTSSDPESSPSPSTNGSATSTKVEESLKHADHWAKAQEFNASSASVNLHSQATAFARLAHSETVKSPSLKSSGENDTLSSDPGLLAVLPVSAESAGFLPGRKESVKGSDIMLEAVLEAEVAKNAKDFFSRPENHIPPQKV